MFCEKCGNELADMAHFCTKCGNELDNGENTRNNKEILLEVTPTFKFAYIVLPKLLKEFIIMFPCILIIVFFIIILRKISFSDSSLAISMLPTIKAMLIVISPYLVRILYFIGKAFFDKKQYQNYTYTFYGDRVVFKDSFLNVSEKELKYANIREIAKRQTFIQRYFNIGNIEIFSNAESGLVNGIYMLHIENVDDIYRKIKEIINI